MEMDRTADVAQAGVTGAGERASRPRRAGRLASGAAIREAAASLFLEKGYLGTSMDEVAAAAQISKQTIYTHFASKEELFADLVLGNAERVEGFVSFMSETLRNSRDLESGMRDVARQYIRLVMRPEVLRLRRLVLGEVSRFPDLARTYYERVPGRVLGALAELFAELGAQGRLRVEDPELAAQHFAWLTLGIPLDKGMFYPIDETVKDVDVDRMADAATRVFLAAYSPLSPRSR
jgi:TetR/AcrR family transcriptional regulator, mexJK operon transcriptional repressor